MCDDLPKITFNRSRHRRHVGVRRNLQRQIYIRNEESRVPPLPDIGYDSPSVDLPDLNKIQKRQSHVTDKHGSLPDLIIQHEFDEDNGNSLPDLEDCNNENDVAAVKRKQFGSRHIFKSSRKHHERHPTKFAKKRKKRMSVDMMRLESNAILGELFSVNKSSDSDCVFIGSPIKVNQKPCKNINQGEYYNRSNSDGSSKYNLTNDNALEQSAVNESFDSECICLGDDSPVKVQHKSMKICDKDCDSSGESPDLPKRKQSSGYRNYITGDDSDESECSQVKDSQTYKTVNCDLIEIIESQCQSSPLQNTSDRKKLDNCNFQMTNSRTHGVFDILSESVFDNHCIRLTDYYAGPEKINQKDKKERHFLDIFPSESDIQHVEEASPKYGDLNMSYDLRSSEYSDISDIDDESNEQVHIKVPYHKKLEKFNKVFSQYSDISETDDEPNEQIQNISCEKNEQNRKKIHLYSKISEPDDESNEKALSTYNDFNKAHVELIDLSPKQITSHKKSKSLENIAIGDIDVSEESETEPDSKSTQTKKQSQSLYSEHLDTDMLDYLKSSSSDMDKDKVSVENIEGEKKQFMSFVDDKEIEESVIVKDAFDTLISEAIKEVMVESISLHDLLSDDNTMIYDYNDVVGENYEDQNFHVQDANAMCNSAVVHVVNASSMPLDEDTILYDEDIPVPNQKLLLNDNSHYICEKGICKSAHGMDRISFGCLDEAKNQFETELPDLCVVPKESAENCPCQTLSTETINYSSICTCTPRVSPSSGEVLNDMSCSAKLSTLPPSSKASTMSNLSTELLNDSSVCTEASAMPNLTAETIDNQPYHTISLSIPDLRKEAMNCQTYSFQASMMSDLSTKSLNNSLNPSATPHLNLAPTQNNEKTSNSATDIPLLNDTPEMPMLLPILPVCRKRKVRCKKTHLQKPVKQLNSNTHAESSRTRLNIRQCRSTEENDVCVDQLCNYVKTYCHVTQSVPNKCLLPSMQKNLLDECVEEGGVDFSHLFFFLSHFRNSFTIPPSVVELVIQNVLFNDGVSLHDIHNAQDLLMGIAASSCSSMVELNWLDIETSIRFILNSALSFKTQVDFLRNEIFLNFVLSVLKVDLYGRNLTNVTEIRNSKVYALLSQDVSSTNRKIVVSFLQQVLDLMANNDSAIMLKLLNLLQELIALCVDISSSCQDCAMSLGMELKTIYVHLPSMATKRLLLQSMASELLLNQLTILLLETQFDNTLPLCQFSLRAVVNSFFKAVPQVDISTPPTTSEVEAVKPFTSPCHPTYLPEQVEELVMLLYLVVKSYLQVSKAKLNMALRLRSQCTLEELSLDAEDQQILKKWTVFTERLQKHINTLTADVTPRTYQYVMLMECLAEL